MGTEVSDLKKNTLRFQWCQFLPSLAHFLLWAVPQISRGLWTVSPCTGVYFVAFEPSCWCVTTVPRVGSLDLASLVQRLAPAACPKFGRRAHGGHRACARARIAPRRWWRSSLGRQRHVFASQPCRTPPHLAPTCAYAFLEQDLAVRRAALCCACELKMLLVCARHAPQTDGLRLAACGL